MVRKNYVKISYRQLSTLKSVESTVISNRLDQRYNIGHILNRKHYLEKKKSTFLKMK